MAASCLAVIPWEFFRNLDYLDNVLHSLLLLSLPFGRPPSSTDTAEFHRVGGNIT